MITNTTVPVDGNRANVKVPANGNYTITATFMGNENYVADRITAKWIKEGGLVLVPSTGDFDTNILWILLASLTILAMMMVRRKNIHRL